MNTTAFRLFSVTVHPFISSTPYSRAYESGDPSSPNALIWIGGLTSGPHTTPQVDPLVQALTYNRGLQYSFWEFRMRSSYSGPGHSSLANDAQDLAALVRYLKAIGKDKIVLLGSSTGCQAILTYATSVHTTPLASAYILQAPTSDRETAGLLMPQDFLAKTLNHAAGMIMRGGADEVMPKELVLPIFNCPITAYRWQSLIARGGNDDLFASDLDDDTLAGTFGKLRLPTLILPSENDEMVPWTVDKQGLLERWIRAAQVGVVSRLSGLNPGADRTLSEEKAQKWFVERVMRFLKGLEA